MCTDEMAAVLNTCTLIATTRVASELALRPWVRDLQTPSRVAALVHGVLCSAALLEGDWLEAVRSTGLFFGMDLALSLGFRQRLGWDTVMHHVLGLALCLFSVLTRSFHETHMGSDLTRTLILFETCNPLLHLLVTLRKEGLQARLPRWALQALQAVFLLQFAGIRLGKLGHSLWHLALVFETATDFEKSMFFFSLAMWGLQWMWFVKLVAARSK